MHQFDKVEMFSFVAPEQAAAEHERLLAIEESIMQELGIPYRVVAIAVDDLGASAAKKYDVEAWLPGPGPLPRADLVLEHDRLPGAAARHPLPRRRTAGRPTSHTLNGTAVAVGRTIIALLENGQQRRRLGPAARRR